jgi:DNA (cytosine-5)-methyltransferase 1
MNSIDLFCGCGGMTLGFQWAGFESLVASDIDENCGKTIKRNFPATEFIVGDISLVARKSFEKIIDNREIDVVTGGPPCQGFSLANKNRNKIEDDPRNKLFYEFVKVIKWVNPKAFVMENVKGLLSMHKGEVIKTIVSEFEKAGVGYQVAYRVLKASDYGVPQNRERVILIGFRKDLNLFPEFPTRRPETITVDDAISDLPRINAGEGDNRMSYESDPKNKYQSFMRTNSSGVYNHVAMRHTKRLIERFGAIKPGQNLIDVWESHGAVKRGSPEVKSQVKFSQNNQRLHGDRPAPTIAASFQSNFIHPYLNRNFTAREGARLQSFPDDFIFEGMRTKMSWEEGLSQYQQIGNAVPPLMAMAVAEKLRSVLENGNSIELVEGANRQLELGY